MTAVTMIFMNRYDGLFARYEQEPVFDVAKWLVNTYMRIRAEFKRRRDAEHLNGLPAYLLDDIGVARSDIHTIVREG